MREAAQIANFAAGVEVGKAGVSTVSPEEVLAVHEERYEDRALVSNLIECAGGRNVLANEKRYPTREPHEIDADVIFLPDEPYLFTRGGRERIRVARGRSVPRPPLHVARHADGSRFALSA